MFEQACQGKNLNFDIFSISTLFGPEACNFVTINRFIHPCLFEQACQMKNLHFDIFSIYNKVCAQKKPTSNKS